MRFVLLTLTFLMVTGVVTAQETSGLMDILPDGVNTALTEGAKDEHSPIGMFMAADVVVKVVMLSLIFASVVSWVIFGAKILSLRTNRLTLKRGYKRLDKAGYRGAVDQGLATRKGIIARMFKAAVDERVKTGAGEGLKAGIKERVGSELSRIEIGGARKMSTGLSTLANIGSTAPFVGLFGTVWGIMNSFVSIAESNTTNLSVVAPGIAEALLATALGLVAAIPAVIFYNLLTRELGTYKIMLGDAGALVERCLSRDLDQVETAPTLVAQAAE